MYQQIHGVAAGRNKHVPVLFTQHPLIFVLDNGCTDSGFLRIGKSELFKGGAHIIDPDSVIIRGERRREACYHRSSALDHDPDLLGFACYLLCVLRTYHKALTAENAFVSDDVRLISREAYRLHGAVADTFVAVFAV